MEVCMRVRSARLRTVSFVLSAALLWVPALAQQSPPAAPAVAPSAQTPGPSAADALKALEAARAAAGKIGVLVSCAVVDSRGDLVALTRMDGARFYTVDIAR